MNAATTSGQSHSGAVRVQIAAATPATASVARPSDDEILGLVTHIESPSSNESSGDAFEFDESQPEPGIEPQQNAGTTEPAQFRAIFEANPELREAWSEAQSFREIFPDIESAREIQKLFPTVDDAKAANSQVSDLARIDALFFSDRSESHAELAAAIYRLNPKAFRNLAQMMNAMNAAPGRDGQPVDATAFGNSAQPQALANRRAPATIDGDNLQQPGEIAPANVAQEHAFFHETNAAAVEGVLSSIQSQLERLLPEGTPKNTRQRLTGEIYRAIDASLQSNRAFGQQLRQAFRSGQLTADNQRAIVGMVVGRAKQALPGVAKRVLGEWTSGVVAHASTRQERQRNAAKRVDIAGGAPGGDGPRALMPKDIDYRRMSDSDILNM